MKSLKEGGETELKVDSLKNALSFIFQFKEQFFVSVIDVGIRQQ